MYGIQNENTNLIVRITDDWIKANEFCSLLNEISPTRFTVTNLMVLTDEDILEYKESLNLPRLKSEDSTP